MGPSTAWTLAVGAPPHSETSTATVRSDRVRRSIYSDRTSLAGDLDLIVAESTCNLDLQCTGSLNYIENTGTATVPVFVQRTGSANIFDGIDVGSSSRPALGDIDGDGTLRRCP